MCTCWDPDATAEEVVDAARNEYRKETLAWDCGWNNSNDAAPWEKTS